MAARVDDDLVSETLSLFQAHTEERLTRDDAREIVEDVAAFLNLLGEWNREARAAELDPAASRALVAGGG